MRSETKDSYSLPTKRLGARESILIVSCRRAMIRCRGIPRKKNKKKQRRQRIREIFLEVFDSSLTRRANNFAAALSEPGDGQRARVTAHQLRRFFELCGTPSQAKVGHFIPTASAAILQKE